MAITGIMERWKGKVRAVVLLLGKGGIIPYGQTDLTPMPQIYQNAGAPTSGGSGTYNGFALPGALLIDTTNLKLYQNTNTQASPTWTLFDSSGGSIVFSSTDAIAAHAGGAKTGATAITTQLAVIATIATDGDSVLAPPAGAGGLSIIHNSHASNGAKVYGQTNDTINGVSTATATYLPAGATMILESTAAGAWVGFISGVNGATAQAAPSTPTPPANTSTYFMQGLAGAITPKKTGNVLVTISGNIIGSTVTAGDGIDVQLSYGTGAAPANAAALAGTQVGAVQGARNSNTAVAADILIPFSTSAVVSGLTIDTAYWLDLAAKSIGTNSAMGLTNVSISAVEV